MEKTIYQDRKELSLWSAEYSSGTSWDKFYYAVTAFDEEEAKEKALNHPSKSDVDTLLKVTKQKIIGRKFRRWNIETDTLELGNKMTVIKAKTVYIAGKEKRTYEPVIIIRGDDGNVYSWDEIHF